MTWRDRMARERRRRDLDPAKLACLVGRIPHDPAAWTGQYDVRVLGCARCRAVFSETAPPGAPAREKTREEWAAHWKALQRLKERMAATRRRV